MKTIMIILSKSAGYVIGVIGVIGFSIIFILFNYFSTTQPEVKLTGYAIYETKYSEVIQITIRKNGCDVWSRAGSSDRFYHSIEFEVCPQIKIGDKVKIKMEIIK